MKQEVSFEQAIAQWSDTLSEALIDWTGGRSYWQQGRFYLYGYDRGWEGKRRVAPWSKVVVSILGPDSSEALYFISKGLGITKTECQTILRDRGVR